jgi:hypothetical protein
MATEEYKSGLEHQLCIKYKNNGSTTFEQDQDYQENNEQNQEIPV